jgi:hypothetical protein
VGLSYDLVFCLGIVYHMENPFRFLRNVAAITAPGGVCIFESDTPADAGARGLALRNSQVTLEPGQVRPVLEMRPSRRALRDMVLYAGFHCAQFIEPPADAACKYLAAKTKSVLLARKGAAL